MLTTPDRTKGPILVLGTKRQFVAPLRGKKKFGLPDNKRRLLDRDLAFVEESPASPTKETGPTTYRASGAEYREEK